MPRATRVPKKTASANTQPSFYKVPLLLVSHSRDFSAQSLRDPIRANASKNLRRGYFKQCTKSSIHPKMDYYAIAKSDHRD